MNSNLKKLFFIQLVLVSTFILLTNNFVSFAQGEDQAGEVPQEEDQKLEQRTVKQSPAYQVLGRELTQKEKDQYEGSSTEEIKNQLLYKEQKLVIVRALIDVGESDDVSKILPVFPILKLQTFKELVEYFTGLKEKYGSVKDGLDSVVYDIKDDKQAFEKAASKAYETVFCVSLDELTQDEKTQVFNFLKGHESLSFTKMVQVLVSNLSPDDKQDILNKLLLEINRPDLISRKDFTEKILKQDFTCEGLRELLKPLKAATPKQQGKNPAKK